MVDETSDGGGRAQPPGAAREDEAGPGRPSRDDTHDGPGRWRGAASEADEDHQVQEQPEEGSELELPDELKASVDWLRSTGDSDTVVTQLSGVSTPSTLTQRKQAPAPDGNGRRLGPYEIHQLLGQGGIGMVYRAFDHRLERWVALKLVRADSRAAAQRLLGEAKAQARVDHPNVCQVYEAGEIDGEPFIAMQYLEGKPLGKVYPQMTLREKIEITRRVAEAIHAAHLQGLIHRDIKPGNILVEQSENGRWRPYVLDFGLAREVSAPGDTTTGEVKGTPHYMPPEQVTGDIHQLDERADVYSLGATLYEGLVGCTLYPTTTGVAVLVKVLSEDPEPVRTLDKSLPVDVESIVMHCLERDPAKRYPSAKALADDLQRFLDFEPVEARKITALGRTWRKLRKRRVAALTVMLIASVLFSIGFFVVSKVRSAQRAVLMETYRQEAQRIDKLVRHVYSSPLHDITEEKADIQTRLANLEARDETHSRLARGPKNYALGRGYLALHEYDKAYEHLREAWRLGTRDPEVADALGRTLGALYEKNLRIARRSQGSEAEKEERLEAIRTRFRQPALEMLREGRDVESESAELVEALILFWEEDYEAALAKAEQSYASVPWLYEAKVLQGHVLMAMGMDDFGQGDYSRAMDELRAAREHYDAAATIGRSDAEIYEGQCLLGANLIRVEGYALHGPIRDHFEYGAEACRRARMVDSERLQPFLLESMLYYRMGETELYEGVDPVAELTHAAEAAAQALERDPKNVEAHASQGWAYALLAQWKTEHGGDPRADAERAIELFRASRDIDETFAEGHSGLAYARFQLARWQLENGEDPGPTVGAAIDDLQTAVAVDPGYAHGYDNLGNAFVLRARWQLWQKIDPGSSVLGVEDASASLRQLNPHYVWAHSVLGDALEMRARFLAEAGQDPSESILRARESYRQALEIANEAWVHIHLARLELDEALWLRSRGDDPTDLFDRATERVQRAAAMAPSDPWAWQTAAEIALAEARWATSRGRSPRAAVDRGQRMVEKTLEINGALTEIRAIGALLRRLGATGRAEIAAADRQLEEVLERNPNLRWRYGTPSS